MKFVNFLSISETIKGCYIDPIDVSLDKDVQLLKIILEKTIKAEDTLYMLFHSPMLLKSDEMLEDLKEKKIWEAFSEFHDLPTNQKFYCCTLRFNASRTTALIVRLWKIYGELRWMVPNPSITWENFISYETNLFQEDPEGKKMLIFDFTKFIFIKGSGGESLILNHHKDHLLPDLKDIALKS